MAQPNRELVGFATSKEGMPPLEYCVEVARLAIQVFSLEDGLGSALLRDIPRPMVNIGNASLTADGAGQASYTFTRAFPGGIVTLTHSTKTSPSELVSYSATGFTVKAAALAGLTFRTTWIAVGY